MDTLEQEFFQARIKNQVSHIEDLDELRTIIEALIQLLQTQRETFRTVMEADWTFTTREGPSADSLSTDG